MDGTLTLKDEKFALKKSVLSGYLGDPYWQDTSDEGRNPGLVWSIRVDPEELVELDEVEEIDDSPPSLECGGVRFPVRRWTDLSGQIAHFKAFGEEIDAPVAHSITSVWEQLPYATLQILERTGRSFGIRWEGVCDLWEPEGNLPFLIQAQAIFETITVHGSDGDTMETLAKRLSLYIAVEDFIQHPIETLGQSQTGRQMFYCRFEPKV